MEATKIARFFDIMHLNNICFSVDSVGSSLRHHFGAKGNGAEEDRDGVFLAVYVAKNSCDEDCFFDCAKNYLGEPKIYAYKSPYGSLGEDTEEMMYIIEVTD